MFFVPLSQPIGKAGERAICRPAWNGTRWSDGGNHCFILFLCGVTSFLFRRFGFMCCSCIANDKSALRLLLNLLWNKGCEMLHCNHKWIFIYKLKKLISAVSRHICSCVGLSPRKIIFGLCADKSEIITWNKQNGLYGEVWRNKLCASPFLLTVDMAGSGRGNA